MDKLDNPIDLMCYLFSVPPFQNSKNKSNPFCSSCFQVLIPILSLLRQLIECIRSKDTDALIDTIDSGGVEVNFMDDVGQTLLNWASAFGTQEMVEFLCERGADVNKGKSE